MVDSDKPLIEVVWADHYSDFEDGFNDEDIQKLIAKPAIRKSSGYLVGENRRQIAIAGTVEEDGTYSEVFVCMKKCIISRSDRT